MMLAKALAKDHSVLFKSFKVKFVGVLAVLFHSSNMYFRPFFIVHKSLVCECLFRLDSLVLI